MLIDVLLIVAGLAVLVLGGELLVRGAIALATRFGLTPAVVGLTVVAGATSMPELVVSVIAAFQGSPDVAVGNVIGSNIFNIGLVLGITSLIVSVPVARVTMRLEWPFLLLASGITLLFMSTESLNLIEGCVLLVLLGIFLWRMVVLSRREVMDTPELPSAVPSTSRAMILNLFFLAAGLALMLLGASWMVRGSTAIARDLGVSERIIGLTIVAMGTSLPELASSVIAAVKGRTDLALGNVLGSCIFNLLAILGTASLLKPVMVNPEFFAFNGLLHVGDVWWMLLFSVILGPMMFFRHKRIGRIDGAILCAVFGAYMWQLLAA